MKKLDVLNYLAKYVTVRKAIAVLVALAFCILAVRGQISSSELISIFSMIVGFYFGRSSVVTNNSDSKK